MKWRICKVVCSLLLGALLIAPGVSFGDGACTGAIAIELVAHDGSTPSSGKVVRIQGRDGRVLTITGRSGRCVINNLPAGQHLLYVELPGGGVHQQVVKVECNKTNLHRVELPDNVDPITGVV